MSLPKELNLSMNKPLASQGKPYINRFRSDNLSYTNGDVIRIEIPTGRAGSYLFPKDCFIDGKIKLNYTTPSTFVGAASIDQSIYSIFQRMRIFHSSVMVEDCLNTHRLWTAIYDLQCNENKRRGDCINKLVYDPSFSAATSIYENSAVGSVNVNGVITIGSTTQFYSGQEIVFTGSSGSTNVLISIPNTSVNNQPIVG